MQAVTALYRRGRLSPALWIIFSAALLLAVLPARAQQQGPTLGLEPVAEGLTSPVAMAQPPDESGRLFIVDQTGTIHIVDAQGTLLDEPFLDLSGRIVELMDNFDERGLLGLAFHPDYADNGRFFVYYSAPLRASAPDDFNHTSHVSEFQVSAGDPNRADPNSEEILLQVDQPQFNHNAGTIAFGPEDDFLYISLGDGGGANDTGSDGDLVGHVDDWYDFNAGGNGQDVEQNLLGSILRIDVDTGDPYGIPQSNPFVGRDGMDEIWAYGFRNPYRFSFDQGGENMLLVGDAGQHRWEEVSRVEQGGNYGWNVYEGTHCFDAANPDTDADSCPDVVGAGHPAEGDPLIDPVIEYQNANQEGGLGLVVVGGVVYRGSELPDLQGRYLFGDWSSSFENPRGQVFVATEQDEGLWPFEQIIFANTDDGELGRFLLAFGQDAEGEAYLLTTDTPGPTGETGAVYRLVPESAVANEPTGEVPGQLTLAQNYPNPFAPHTSIRYRTTQPGPVALTVYDVLGREVVTLVDQHQTAGVHTIEWDGTDADGRRLSSGTYVYRLRTDDATETRVMTLLE